MVPIPCSTATSRLCRPNRVSVAAGLSNLACNVEFTLDGHIPVFPFAISDTPMGGEPYRYTVPYEQDIQRALNKLRNKVFESGEFNGSEFSPSTPQEALEMAAEDGTGSILDISQISPEPEYCCASPLNREDLIRYFGTDQPTAQQVDESDDFWDELDRGQARYFILYHDGQPAHIHFVGYSFD